MEKAPNEKLIETLFIYYALRYLERFGASVYTPSTCEEYEDGYDARLMGASSFDELYLQFKTPFLLRSDYAYTFETYGHQHDRLQQYDFDTAYYLTHLFRSVEQVQQAQREATDPLGFLERYVAIEIGRLGKVQRFRYFRSTTVPGVDQVLYKLRTDRPREHPKRKLRESEWMTGAELLRRFERNEVGARMILMDREGEDEADAPRLRVEQKRDRVCPMSRERAREMGRGDDKMDGGILLRKNSDLLPRENESNRCDPFPDQLPGPAP